MTNSLLTYYGFRKSDFPNLVQKLEGRKPIAIVVEHAPSETVGARYDIKEFMGRTIPNSLNLTYDRLMLILAEVNSGIFNLYEKTNEGIHYELYKI